MAVSSCDPGASHLLALCPPGSIHSHVRTRTMWSLPIIFPPPLAEDADAPLPSKNSKGPGNLFIGKSCGRLSCLVEALTSPSRSCIVLSSDIFSCSLASLGESQICKSRPQKAWQSVLGVYWKGERGSGSKHWLWLESRTLGRVSFKG